MIISYTEAILSLVAGLFLSSFLLRALGDFEYGLYQTMSSFVNYLVVLEFGIGGVMCRNLLVSKGSEDVDKTKKITATLWYVTLILGVIIIAVGLVFGFSIGAIYEKKIGLENVGYAQKVFYILLIYLVVSFFSQALSGVFIGNENYYIGNTIRIAKLVLRTVILIVTVYSFRFALTIALCDAVISVGVLFFTLIYVIKKYDFSFNIRYFDKAVLKDSLPLCISLLIQTIINQANNNVDKFIISIRMDMASVSLYSIAMYIYSMFSSITSKPITLYMPQVANNVKKGLKGKDLAKSTIPFGRLVAIIGGTILFGFIASGRQFIEIVYGKEYLSAWITAIIVLIPTFINMTGGNLNNMLDVLNKRQIRSYILIITTVINIALTIWFVGLWGIVGAAIATAFSLIVGQLFLLNIYFYKWHSINVWWLYLQSFKGIVLAEIIASVIAFAVGVFIKNSIFSFFITGTLYVILEFALLWAFGFNSNEKQIVKKIFNKIRKRSNSRD